MNRVAPRLPNRSLLSHRAVRYGGALLAIVAAMGLRLVLDEWFGPGLPPFITFYPMMAGCCAG